MEWAPLAPLIRQAADCLNAEESGRHSIDGAIEPTAACLRLRGERALTNRIGNGVRHNPAGCAIRIFLALRGRFCILDASDTGAGYSGAQLTALNQKTCKTGSGRAWPREDHCAAAHAFSTTQTAAAGVNCAFRCCVADNPVKTARRRQADRCLLRSHAAMVKAAAAKDKKHTEI